VSKAKQHLDLAGLRGRSTAVSSASRGQIQKQAGKPVMDSNLRLYADDTDGYIDLIQPGSGALLSQLPLVPASIQRRLRPTAT
jgi:hypothetical protein